MGAGAVAAAATPPAAAAAAPLLTGSSCPVWSWSEVNSLLQRVAAAAGHVYNKAEEVLLLPPRGWGRPAEGHERRPAQPGPQV